MNIREASKNNWPQISLIFKEIVSVGDTYAFRKNTTTDEAEAIWLHAPRKNIQSKAF